MESESSQKEKKSRQVKKPCIGCVYYDACGCSTRTHVREELPRGKGE